MTLDGRPVEILETLKGFNPRHGWIRCHVVRYLDNGQKVQLSAEASRRIVRA